MSKSEKIRLGIALAILAAFQVFAVYGGEPEPMVWKPYVGAHAEWAKGKTMIVYVGATWCPHCPKAKAECEKVLKSYGDQVVGVALDADKHKELVGIMAPNSPLPTMVIFGAHSQTTVVGWDKKKVVGAVEKHLKELRS